MLTSDDFVGRLDKRIALRLREHVELAELDVRKRRALLDDAQRADHLARERLAANLEVLA